MVPGGTTESIAHFIGYLHLFEDSSRTHLILDGAPRPAHIQASSETPQSISRPDLSADDLASHRVDLDYQPGDFKLLAVAKHKLMPPPPIGLPHPHLGPMPPLDADHPDPGLPDLGGIGVTSTVTPAPLPDQLLADLHQVNGLENNGVVLTATSGPTMALLAAALHDGTDGTTLPDLLDQAKATTPDWLPAATGSSQELVASVAQHDAGDHATAPAGSVQPGIYADGAAQPAGTDFAPGAPTPAAALADTSHNGMTDPGVAAETGGNTTTNLASILDDHTQHTGLAVLGNAYTTDVIVQTNVLHSLADIVVGGGPNGGAPDIATDGNTAHNLASFASHDTSASFVASGMPWGHLQVDTINGDFFDVKGFSQTNYLANNDMVAQTAETSYSAIQSGGDTQINALPFSELAQNYDLIIVEGSFHNANYIVQQNVFLNDDVIRMVTGRGDTASQSVTTGDNSLANSASIDHYGATTYQPLGHDMAAWLAQVETGSLGRDSGALPSIGSSLLHVLDIKGDFFDVNFLSQTNVVSNADTVAQFMPDVGSSFAPTGATTTSTMSVDAGHNQLANLASIAVVGTTSGFQFVGGQHYDDAILVQANLVSDKSHVVVGDTHTLANEIVAFTGLHDALPTAHEPVHAAMPVDSSLHHDLFHGIMT